MNAADQRRLTPVLGLVCGLLALAVVAIVAGVGRQPETLDATPATASASSRSRAAAITPMPPLDHYAAVWQQPLFNADRQPADTIAADGDAPVSLGDLVLTGIMLTPQVRVALMHDRHGGHDVRVREGERLPDSSWMLQKLESRRAVFVNGAQSKVVKLAVADTAPASVVTSVVNGGKPASGTRKPPPSMLMRGGRRLPPPGAARKGGKKPAQKPATSGARKPGIERRTRARMQALRARIKARRQMLQARKHGDR